MEIKNYPLAGCIDLLLKSKESPKETEKADEQDSRNRIVFKSTYIRLKESDEVNGNLLTELKKMGIEFSYDTIYEPVTKYCLSRGDYAGNAPDNIDNELNDMPGERKKIDAMELGYLKQSINKQECIPSKFRITETESVLKSDVLGTKPEETLYWIHYIMRFSRNGQEIMFYSDSLRKELQLPAFENEIERKARYGNLLGAGAIKYNRVPMSRKKDFYMAEPIKYCN